MAQGKWQGHAEDGALSAQVHSCIIFCCHQITNNYWIWFGSRSTWHLRANPGPLNQIHNWTDFDSEYFQLIVLLGRGSTACASVTTPVLGYEVAGGFCDVYWHWLNLRQVLLKIELFWVQQPHWCLHPQTQQGIENQEVPNTENYPFWVISMNEQDMLNIQIRYNHDKEHLVEIKST